MDAYLSSLKVALKWERLLEQVRTITERVGRRPEEITIVGVAKGQIIDKIIEAISAGLRDIGENRVQEARMKKPIVEEGLNTLGIDPHKVRWHMVGRLQSNKIPYVVRLFDAVHSVEKADHAEKLSLMAGTLGKVIEVWMEVNTSGETTKGGVPPEEALPLAERLMTLPHLKWKGLMTVGPLSDDPEKVRSAFRRLRVLKEKLEEQLALSQPLGLSMGMSDDFPIAIEEGATVIRIGTALFGPRSPQGHLND
ncbi:MAG: YggS family pyridoxal phosphate-dependent enzyme [bacterium]